MVKQAGVVIDAYKLDVFKRHFKKAGLTYTQADGPVPGLITLQIEYEMVVKIQPIIEAANKEASRLGARKK